MTDVNATPNTESPAATPATPEATAATPSWFDSLPDDIKAEPSLQNFKGKDTVDVIKGYVSAQKELGSRIRIPGPDASDEVKGEFMKKLEGIPGVTKLPDPNKPEELNAFFNKLGRPATPDAYKFDADPKLLNADAAIQFKQMAHAMGLTAAQANELVKFDVAREQSRVEGFKKAADEAKATLKEMWGGEFDNRMKDVSSLLEHYSSKHGDQVKALINSEAANNPVLLSMLADLSRSFKEAGVIKGDSTLKYGLTPADAQAKINEVLSNTKHDYYSEDNSKRAAAVAYVAGLYEAKNAGKE